MYFPKQLSCRFSLNPRPQPAPYGIMRAFAWILAVLVVILGASAREDVVPKLVFNLKNCYRRQQICCYRYKKAGKRCKQRLCTRKPYCKKTNLGKCVQYGDERTCLIRCYYVMRPKYECTPNELVMTKGYVHSKEHLEFIPRDPEVRRMN